jgi:predicted DNA-binding WGR domain protein
MRRFELVEGTSNKFWEVALSGADVTVRFGRIGTNGQTKTKTHASPEAARKDHDKLVKEKTSGGYNEVAVAPGATPAPAAAPAASSTASAPEHEPEAEAPATPATQRPVASPPVPAAASKAATPATAVGPIAWPQGGFDWTDGLRASLPIVRGVHAPALSGELTAMALLASPLVFEDDPHGYSTQRFAELAAAMGRSWSRWGTATSTEKIQRAHLESDDPETWLELCAQSLDAQVKRGDGRSIGYYGRSYPLVWMTHVGIGLHGLPFMVERTLDFARAVQSHAHNLTRVLQSMIDGALRPAIASGSDADHDAVVALLERQAGSTTLDRLIRAQLCPHRQDWVEASLDEDKAGHHYWLRDCAAPADAMRRYFADFDLYYQSLEPCLLLQLRLHDAGAFALLADSLRKVEDRAACEKLTGLVARLRAPETIQLLAELIERKESRAALDKLSEKYPAAVLKCVVEQALSSRSRLAEGWAVRLALREPAALTQVLAALDDGPRERFQALLDALDVQDAPAEALPPLLREPPWLRKARATELPTLAVEVVAPPERFDWSEQERARHAEYEVRGYRRNATDDPVAAAFERLRIVPAGRARIAAGQPLQAGDIDIGGRYFYGESPESALLMPVPAMLALWNSYPAKYWMSYSGFAGAVRAILARGGTDALPGLAAYVQTWPEDGLAIALEVDSPRLVPTALHALRNHKKAKAPAIAWIRAHVATTLAVALPAAFGSARASRDDAQFALRWLVANGFDAQAREAAAGYGTEMAAAFEALLAADPLLVLPTRMPKLPGFFVAPSMRRPQLRDNGGALSTTAIEHVGSMLQISRLDAPYAGLAIVKEACTPESLGEFAWDVFEAWIAGGAPSKESWAFAGLGLLGNDETARRLAPRIREWPGQSQHQRAVTGLDLLAAIGSDVALMHLNGIAGKVKFKALQDRAKEKIAAVAEARGFTAAELADRLVPDLGLDERGTLALDFGPRQFFIGFDETLKPFVKDAQGVRLKDLPKPIRTDDAALSAAATDRFKQLKKDAKAIASLQVTRLEMSMVDRRRWPAADFRLFFLEHPLMRHLAARLVWGVYDANDVLTGAFRIAEDWTFADGHDSQFELPADARVGLVHVIEMPAPMQAAFGQIFADYEILQPFKQLGRETYALTPQERAVAKIDRFAAKTIATGSVMGLINRGWERGDAQDAGWVGWFTKRVGDGLEVQLELDPGTVVGDVSYEPKQRIPNLVLRKTGSWNDEGLRTFDALHPIVASELLRDAELLAPFVDA